MKPRIVVIGANDFQNQLILKAKEKGYETHVFAWQCGDVGEFTADFFYPVSIVEKEQILEKCKEIQPRGIVSIASDLANITVNYVAEMLGLSCNGVCATDVSTNKHRMRQCFTDHDLPSPKSFMVSSVEQVKELELDYPIIVKPTDRSGSRGIFKLENGEHLEDAILGALSYSFEKKVLVEEFAQGDEYSVEYISYEGEHHFLNITKKFTTGAPYFIETGHIEPSMLSDMMVEKVRNVVERALDALGVKYGASHSELKIDQDGNIKIIEIGSRMGGDCIGSDLVYLSTGYDFVDMVIDVACGNAPKLERKREKAFAAIRFIYNQKDLDNLNWIKENYPEIIWRVSEIEDINSRVVVDSSTRFGYFIVVTESEKILQDVIPYISMDVVL